MEASNHFHVPARITPPFYSVHRLALNRTPIIILISPGRVDAFHSRSWFKKPQEVKRFNTFAKLPLHWLFRRIPRVWYSGDLGHDVYHWFSKRMLCLSGTANWPRGANPNQKSRGTRLQNNENIVALSASGVDAAVWVPGAHSAPCS
jgi:hypothetical protein